MTPYQRFTQRHVDEATEHSLATWAAIKAVMLLGLEYAEGGDDRAADVCRECAEAISRSEKGERK